MNVKLKNKLNVIASLLNPYANGRPATLSHPILDEMVKEQLLGRKSDFTYLVTPKGKEYLETHSHLRML